MRKLRTVLGSVLLAVALTIVAMATPVVADRGDDDDHQNREAGVGSPTNGQIVFRRYFNDEQTKGALFVMNPDGSEVRRVTHPPKGWRDNVPAWSPDGQTIVFERFKADDSTSRVMVVDPDTGETRTVVPCTGERCLYAIDPYFSPDSQSIAYARTVAPPHVQDPPEWQLYSAIFVVGVDGSDARQVSSTPEPPPRTATSVRHHRSDVLARRQDARLPARSIRPGGEHCGVRPADRLAGVMLSGSRHGA